MPKTFPVYRDFSGGEVTPKIYGQTQLKAYVTGAEVMVNWEGEIQGLLSYRSGTKYVATTEGDDLAVLYDYHYNSSFNYELEFTEKSIRIIDENGLVEVSPGVPVVVDSPYLEADLKDLQMATIEGVMYIDHVNYEPRKFQRTSVNSFTLSRYTRLNDPFTDKKNITNITQSNPAVVTVTAHGLANGTEIIIEDVIGMTQVNGNKYIVANVTANTFELQGIDSTGFASYISGGYETITSKFPGAVTAYESRVAHMGTAARGIDYYLSRSPDAITGLPRYEDFTTGTDPDNAVFGSVSPSITTSPILWCIGTDKMLAIGTDAQICKMTGSGTDQPITPSSIRVTVASSQGASKVTPLISGNEIIYTYRTGKSIIGLTFNFLSESFQDVDKTIASDHLFTSGVVQLKQDKRTPSRIYAVMSDGTCAFLINKGGEEIGGWQRIESPDIGYNINKDYIKSGDSSYISIGVLSRQDEYDRLYFVMKRENNYYIEYRTEPVVFKALPSFYTSMNAEKEDLERFNRYIFEQQRYPIYLDSSNSYYGQQRGIDANASVTPAAISGIGVIFTASSPVFAITDVGKGIWKRCDAKGNGAGRATITTFIDSTTVLCNISVIFDSLTAMSPGMWYITSNQVDGMGHLEGQLVSMVMDGGVGESKEVIGGVVTADNQASVIHAGIAYRAIYLSTNLELGVQGYDTQTKLKIITRMGIRLLNTLGLKYGPNLYQLERGLFFSAASYTGRPPALFSGDREVHFPNGYSRPSQLALVHDVPLPAQVQLVALEAQI